MNNLLASRRWLGKPMGLADDRLNDRAGRISKPPERAGKKGAACPGPGPLPRGSEYQNPCRWRRLGQSGQADRRSRTGKRYHSCARTHRRVHRRRISPTKATTPITCTIRLSNVAAKSSSRQNATAKSSALTTLISTKNAISSSASSIS
jgi:hypothetical protein